MRITVWSAEIIAGMLSPLRLERHTYLRNALLILDITARAAAQSLPEIAGVQIVSGSTIVSL